MMWSERDWSIYSKGIVKMLQKSVRKVLRSISTISKTWPNWQCGHVYKKVRRDPSMIDWFMGVANLKSCKNGVKSARIDLRYLTVLNPLKNRVLLAKFRANRSKSAKILRILVKSKKAFCKKILKLYVD